MRNLSLLFAVFLFAVTLPGCGFKDLDKRFFPIAIGIDEGENATYKISLKLAIPSPRTEPGESKFQVVSQEADTIAEAVRLLKSKVDKEFDFGHALLIIIGKPFADRHELGHTMDWFFRRRDIQMSSFFAIGEPNALEVIKTKPRSERLPGNGLILPFTGEGTNSPYLLPVQLFDYYRRLRDYGKDAFLPIVKAEPETFVIDRVAILKSHDKKLELTPRETSTFKQLARTYPRFVVTAKLQNKWITFSGARLSVGYKILTPSGGTPEIRFRIAAEMESEDSQIPLFDQSWTKLERLVEGEMQDRTLALLRKLQQNGVDPIGFGMRYRATRHHGRAEIEEWKKIYPNVRFTVNVHAHFRGTGIIK